MGTEGKETLVMGKTLKPKPNILITTQVFPPEIHPSAVMVKELVKDLSERRWQVSLATGYPHHPFGRLYPGYKKQFLTIEARNGFRVVRGWHLITPNSGFIFRALVMVSQCGAYFLAALASPSPNLVISYGPPLIGPLVSSLIARKNKAKLLTMIYDIYPDILVEMGYLKSSLLIHAARKLENLVYRWSDRIGVLSEGFRRTLIEQKGVDPQKIALIPLWLDVRDILPMSRDNPWRRKYDVGHDKFVVLYAGTIGLISNAEIVVDAARQLESYHEILFLFVGAGFAKDRVEAKARDFGLKNIRFLPFQPRERLAEVQATADVSLVTLVPGRGKTSVPSKVLGYMAAARPVVAAVDEECDTAALIRTARCGLITPPADADSLAQAVLSLLKNPKVRLEMGERGRKYFEAHLEKKQVLTKYVSLIEELVSWQ